MDKNNVIGVLDSGIGGLSTLSAIRELLPYEDYIYYGDRANNPYGEKSDAELRRILCRVVNTLIAHRAKLIVVACNTATTRCIKFLRATYPNIPFVGTEPAIKLACDSGYQKILVMATPGTIQSEQTQQLVAENAKSNQKIQLLSCEGLANAIERNARPEIDNLLANLLGNLDHDFDAVVLGCTHYPHISSEIQKYFPNAKLMDGNLGIARRVQSLLVSHNLSNPQSVSGSLKILGVQPDF